MTIETEYRLGFVSIRQLAKNYNISDSNLRARAAREGWVRSDGEVARTAARAAVATASAAEAREIGADIGAKQAQRLRDGIEQVALSAAEVCVAHQVMARRAMLVADKLLTDLEAASRLPPVVQPEATACPQEEADRTLSGGQGLSLKGRVQALDKWAALFQRLAGTEREAHRQDGDARLSVVDDLLKRIGDEDG